MKLSLNQLVGAVWIGCIRAGAAIMEIYNQADPTVYQKSDKSVLTEADLASNRILCEFLGQITPDVPIISEENEPESYEIRQKYPYFWLIDPLDGTQEFVNRNPEFTINVALVQGTKPILGIIFDPNTGGGYFATQNSGAWHEKDGIRTKIHANSVDFMAKNLRIPTSKSFPNAETQRMNASFDAPIFIEKGSALKFTLIATGAADVYPRSGQMKEWDTAAAQIIIEEAGGQLLQIANGQPLAYNKTEFSTPNFVAIGKSERPISTLLDRLNAVI